MKLPPDPRQREYQHHCGKRRAERAQRLRHPTPRRTDTQQYRRARADRRPGRYPDGIGIGERIPQQPLQRNPGHGKCRPYQRRQQHARQAQFPENVCGERVGGRGDESGQDTMADCARDLQRRQPDISNRRRHGNADKKQNKKSQCGTPGGQATKICPLLRSA